MTAAEVARLLRVRVETVTRYARQGSMPASRVGGTWRFDADQVRAWLNNGGSRRSLAPPRHVGEDPLLKVIGIGADGALSRDIDLALYGRRR